MKKIFYLLGCACIAFSCSTSPKEKQTHESESVESVTNEDSDVTETETTDSTEWDETIDDYEKFIDDYIKFAKEAKAGNSISLTKSMELMQQAEPLGKQLEAAKDKLTSKQSIRLIKIQTKLFGAI